MMEFSRHAPAGRRLVPWSAFDEEYGADWDFDIGSPTVHTSGPNVYGLPITLNNPGQDWAIYSFDLVPLGPCS